MATTSAKVLRLAAASVETTPGAGTAPTRRFGGQTAIGHTRDTAQLAYLSGRLSAVEDTYPALARATVTHRGPLLAEDVPLWLAWFLNGGISGSQIGSSMLYRWAAGVGSVAAETPRTACFELTLPDHNSAITATGATGETLELVADPSRQWYASVAATFRATSALPAVTTPVGLALPLTTRAAVPATYATVTLDDTTALWGTTAVTGTVLGWAIRLTRALDTRYHHGGGTTPDDQLPGTTTVEALVRLRAHGTALSELTKWSGAAGRRLRLTLTAPSPAAPSGVLGYGLDAYGTSPYGSPPQSGSAQPSQTLVLDLGGVWSGAAYGQQGDTVLIEYRLLGRHDAGIAGDLYATATVTTGSLSDA